jgi:hypothetical protein
MTGEEIVALSKKHTIIGAGRQSDPGGCEGRLLLTLKALYRLQQPADVGEHRPTILRDRRHHRRREGHHVTPAMTTEVRARLGAKLAEIAPGDIDASSSPTAARGQRKRLQDRAP